MGTALAMRVLPLVLGSVAVTTHLSTRSLVTTKSIVQGLGLDRSAPRSIVSVYQAILFRGHTSGHFGTHLETVRARSRKSVQESMPVAF
jgi:hypothetical protein